MATRAYTVISDGARNKIVQWTGLGNGDDGQWISFAGRYPDKTMHVYGTPGTGLHVKPYGSNEVGVPANAAQLQDATEDLIDITSVPAIVVILQNTHQFRPVVTGDGSTSITVLLELRA
jgi:hypothetical protein